MKGQESGRRTPDTGAKKSRLGRLEETGLYLPGGLVAPGFGGLALIWQTGNPEGRGPPHKITG
jgi:hypothetical protein